MPTSGYVTSFNQSLPFYADKKFISNTLTNSNYKSFSENVVGAAKIYMTSINGLGDDDVRLNKRKFLPQSRLRGFQRNKVGPMDGDEHIGGNYAAALNFEANLPNLLPENTRTEVGLFLDFGNIWSVDYDSSVGDSNKIRSTTGVAASWISPLGPMTFTFSQDLSKAQTDKTEAFSFNLGTTF
jgi:outer membrane protein insertion porin family